MKKGLILVFTTAVISGFSIFINKYGVSVINPSVFTFLKNTVVALMLTSLILLIKDRRLLKSLTKKQWWLLCLIGLVGGSIPFLLFFKGLSLTGAAQGSFIHKTMFIYVAVLAVIFLKEKISKEFLIGTLLLLLGNLIYLKALPTSFGQGDLLVLLATFLWAIENVISKYALKDLPAKIVAWGRMFFGSIFILVFLLASGQAGQITTLNMTQIGWIFLTALILLGYVLTWYSGLKYVPVSTAAAILLLGSPITTLLSLTIGVKISPSEFLAGTLMIIGLIFIVGFKYSEEKIYVRS
jgi:drug/metabolite transporter (DMT)-like permease